MSTRYALYFAPAPETRWWRFGCEWLGYDAEACAAVRQSVIPAVAADVFAAVTRAPWRYGFHATLKAPMHLAAGSDEAALVAALERFAADREPFELPRMRVGRLDGFLACLPETRDDRMHALADDCVRDFDHFRAPLTPAEIAKRHAANLGAEEAALLERWGYPYVLDAFRFHMTLTGPLAGVLPQVEIAVAEAASSAVDALADEPLVCDGVCLFVQATAAAPFRIRRRFPFGRR
jgi:putative phosphonate metabolism protein